MRLVFHTLLSNALPSINFYFAPPGDALFDRPFGIYEHVSSGAVYANNKPYVISMDFRLTVVSDLPGIENLYSKIASLPGISIRSNTKYNTSDLAHHVFNLTINKI